MSLPTLAELPDFLDKLENEYPGNYARLKGEIKQAIDTGDMDVLRDYVAFEWSAPLNLLLAQYGADAESALSNLRCNATTSPSPQAVLQAESLSSLMAPQCQLVLIYGEMLKEFHEGSEVYQSILTSVRVLLGRLETLYDALRREDSSLGGKAYERIDAFESAFIAHLRALIPQTGVEEMVC